VITAGPTREALDPVRYISNYSSGKMGFALASAAAEAGAQVTLIAGPVNLPTPDRVQRVDVVSAREMFDATQAAIDGQSIFIATAAVADFRPVTEAEQKIKKTSDRDEMTLQLIKNPDILASVGRAEQRPRLVVGFAAESENLAQHAQDKLVRKHLDLIVANDISRSDIGFGAEENEALIFTKEASKQVGSGQSAISWGKLSKTSLARRIVEFLADMYKTQAGD